MNTIYYPGWQAWINDKDVKLSYGANGLIEFPLKAGNSEVVLRFGETPLRLTADFISILSVGVIGYAIFLRRKKRNYSL